MKKNLLLLSTFLFCTLCLGAQQTARQEIEANRLLAASNFLAYIAPTEPLTKAPKGYEPFYISHYGRHGSRWHGGDATYSDILKALQPAAEAGKLTPLGMEVLDKMNRFYPTTVKRVGELTTVGARQHHGIARRMTERFPEVFSGNADVDARSTVVIRCILSMTAECEELMAFNPKMKIHNDVSESFQYYLNQPQTGIVREAISKAGPAVSAATEGLIHPDRIIASLFNDPAYVEENIDKSKLVSRLFDVAKNMQSHDTDISLFEIFNDDEVYDLWRTVNIDWYTKYCSNKFTDFLAPFRQENLLDNILSTADTIVGNRAFHGATLRFGHEVVVLPLAALLELGNTGVQVDDLKHLEDYFHDYDVYPMGCNIQLVFYRPKKGDGDILVKALLNEKEVTMPAETDNFPYYKWSDLRAYYGKKLSDFRALAATYVEPERPSRTSRQ